MTTKTPEAPLGSQGQQQVMGVLLAVLRVVLVMGQVLVVLGMVLVYYYC